MHLDLYTSDQADEVARLRGLGATLIRAHHDPDDDYVVLADPEGNHFCVCAVRLPERADRTTHSADVGPVSASGRARTRNVQHTTG